jgi:hypothetical protein
MQIPQYLFLIFFILGVIIFAVTTTEESSVNAQQNNTTAETGSAQTQSVEILSHKLKGGQFSDTLIGQIQNNFDKNIQSVAVIATFYDETGNIVGTDNGYTSPSDLSKGMKAPFELLLDEGTADDASSYDITLSWRQPGSFEQKSKVFEFSKQQSTDESQGEDEDEE